MQEQNVVSRTAMITRYAQHGLGKKAFLFGKMQKGLKPNNITFMGVLSAYIHAGLADAVIHYFDSMNKHE